MNGRREWHLEGTTESRQTFQRKYWLPFSYRNSGQKLNATLRCSHVDGNLPVSTKHAVLSKTCFTCLGHLSVLWVRVDLKLPSIKKKKNHNWGPIVNRGESVHTWFAAWMTPIALSASLNINLQTVFNSTLCSYHSWCDAWTIYCVLFAFTYKKFSKLLFTFFVLFLELGFIVLADMLMKLAGT